MQIVLANNYGFCFGVKRAINLAEANPNSLTLGPLIHNYKEINRLSKNYYVNVSDDINSLDFNKPVIIRTHGIPKDDLKLLQDKNANIIDATCPFVTKPQLICEDMSKNGYQIIIFGDKEHPEVKGVISYCVNTPIVILSVEELYDKNLSNKIALVSQTTRKISEYKKIVSYLIEKAKELRVFNTICNATFENQESAKKLSQEVDIMLIIGGKNSSNTKQLLTICKENCADSYLIEDEYDLDSNWLIGKNRCGITAGASTPDWIIDNVIKKLQTLKG
ncbi:MAG: 4-hydroxy-3-methylbut-2-enyl diphosphate reductase [Campylobacterales bacterium]|nr:4-hydroxy-3-methylbut-2-enyl diphosphate reductase [Campylobacterales bacterium]